MDPKEAERLDALRLAGTEVTSFSAASRAQPAGRRTMSPNPSGAERFDTLQLSRTEVTSFVAQCAEHRLAAERSFARHLDSQERLIAALFRNRAPRGDVGRVLPATAMPERPPATPPILAETSLLSGVSEFKDIASSAHGSCVEALSVEEVVNLPSKPDKWPSDSAANGGVDKGHGPRKGLWTEETDLPGQVSAPLGKPRASDLRASGRRNHSSMMRIWPKKTLLFDSEEEPSWVKKRLGSFGLHSLVNALEWWQQLQEPGRHGRLHDIIISSWFNFLTASIIFINAFVTFRNADYELQNIGQPPQPHMAVLELTFIAYYATECLLKLAVHKQYFFCNSDMWWNWFDFVVLAFSVFDQIAVHVMEQGGSNISFTRSFRIFRIGKVLRMFRLVHFLADLRKMLESLLGSFTSLFWSFVVLGMILYIFALMFVQSVSAALQDDSIDPVVRDDLILWFGSVSQTTLTLYMSTTSGVDWIEVYTVMKTLGQMYTRLFLFFVSFWNFAVVNILTGIFVDSAMRIASPDRDAVILQQRRKDMQDSKELKVLLTEALDVEPDEEGSITKASFATTVQNPKLHRHLATLGLEVNDVDLFFDTMAANCGESSMSIDEFVAHAIRMKGLASSIDVQGLAIQMRGVSGQLTRMGEAVASMNGSGLRHFAAASTTKGPKMRNN